MSQPQRLDKHRYRPELERVDVAPWAGGNTRIPYAWSFAAAEPGPHLWLNALMHGDEVCGAHALDLLLRREVRPSRGTLSLTFANVRAYENIGPDQPFGTRFVDEDMNRVWGRLEGAASPSHEVARATALLPIAEAADHLIDLHAMTHPSEPLSIVGLIDRPAQVARNVALAKRIGYPTLLVADAGHSSGQRLRDSFGFGARAGEGTALVVECGGWWEARGAEIAIAVCLRAMAAFGMLDRPDLSPLMRLPEAAKPFRLVSSTTTITAHTPEFRFVQTFQGDEVIEKAGTLIAHDGDTPVLTPFDDCFLMFPEHTPLLGATAVRLGRIKPA